MVHVAGLYVYPLKSCSGVARSKVYLGEWGVRGDRRWMWVDGAGEFLTQRAHPVLGKIWAREGVRGLELGFGDEEGATLCVDLGQEHLRALPRSWAGVREVRVWGDACEAWSVGSVSSAWLLKNTGLKGTLVYMPDGFVRTVPHAPQSRVGFADKYPLLVLGTASIEALNARLSEPVDARYFRPNLVVETTEPFVEDRWARIRVSGVEIHILKPCTRCVMVNVIPQTTDRRSDVLKTLATFRREGNSVYFGQNAAVALHEGEVSLGDSVDVLEERVARPLL